MTSPLPPQAAAGHAADGAAGGGADAGFGAFQLDAAHVFHHAHLDLVGAAGLLALVIAAAEAAGATRQDGGDQQYQIGFMSFPVVITRIRIPP
jgi:hypothetical protein